MLKNLLANKKLLAVIVAVIVIIVGIVLAVVISRDSENTGISDAGIETEGDEGVAQESDDDKDEPYNGNGLDIEDEIDGKVDSVDASGDWDEVSDVNNTGVQDNKTDNSKSENTQSDRTEKEESSDTGDVTDGELDNDEIIVDDKVWGEPS